MNEPDAIEIPVRRRSLIWKLMLFVCASVIVTAGLLGWTGYRFTRGVLINQIQDRLSVVAATRQKAVRAYVEHQQDRIKLVTSRTPWTVDYPFPSISKTISILRTSATRRVRGHRRVPPIRTATGNAHSSHRHDGACDEG